jgi:hypothetical protein
MYSLSCILESHSHKLNEKAFSLLKRRESQAQVTDISGRQIEITFKSPKQLHKNIDEFYPKAHLMASNFVIAINIATLGHFTWLNGNQLFPTYHSKQTKEKNIQNNIIFTSQRSYPLELKEISENEIRNTVIMYPSLLLEKDQYIRQEYVKGIIHMGLSFHDVRFDKDAFANFYRLFEYFVTNKILKTSKLKNELKQFKEVIYNLGMGSQITDEFRNIYKLRSDQVMHAQRDQVEIDPDDVIKIKAYLDFVLNKHYRKIADEWLEKGRSTSNIALSADT